MIELVAIHFATPRDIAWDKNPASKKRALWCRQPYNNDGFLLRISDLYISDRNGDTGLPYPSNIYSYKGTGVNNQIEEWKPNFYYSVGDIVYTGSSDDTDTHYICVNSGTSGNNPPTTTDLTVIERPDAGNSSVEWVYAPFLKYTVNSIDRRIKAYAGNNLVRWNKIGQTTDEQLRWATRAALYNLNINETTNQVVTTYRLNNFGRFNGTDTVYGTYATMAITTFAKLDVDYSPGSFLDINGFLKLDVHGYSKDVTENIWVEGRYNLPFISPNPTSNLPRGKMSCFTACWMNEYGNIIKNSSNYIIPSTRLLVGGASANGVWMGRSIENSHTITAANLSYSWGNFIKIRYSFSKTGVVFVQAFDDSDNEVISRIDYNGTLNIPSSGKWVVCMTFNGGWPEQQRFNKGEFIYG